MAFITDIDFSSFGDKKMMALLKWVVMVILISEVGYNFPLVCYHIL